MNNYSKALADGLLNQYLFGCSSNDVTAIGFYIDTELKCFDDTMDASKYIIKMKKGNKLSVSGKQPISLLLDKFIEFENVNGLYRCVELDFRTGAMLLNAKTVLKDIQKHSIDYFYDHTQIFDSIFNYCKDYNKRLYVTMILANSLTAPIVRIYDIGDRVIDSAAKFKKFVSVKAVEDKNTKVVFDSTQFETEISIRKVVTERNKIKANVNLASNCDLIADNVSKYIDFKTGLSKPIECGHFKVSSDKVYFDDNLIIDDHSNILSVIDNVFHLEIDDPIKYLEKHFPSSNKITVNKSTPSDMTDVSIEITLDDHYTLTISGCSDNKAKFLRYSDSKTKFLIDSMYEDLNERIILYLKKDDVLLYNYSFSVESAKMEDGKTIETKTNIFFNNVYPTNSLQSFSYNRTHRDNGYGESYPGESYEFKDNNRQFKVKFEYDELTEYYYVDHNIVLTNSNIDPIVYEPYMIFPMPKVLELYRDFDED